MKNIENKSLNGLIGNWQGEIPQENYSSSIQLRTYNLYFKRIKDYEIDDIRFMIGQEIGLKHLVPIALSYLKDNILLEANYYEGDLLKVILLLPKSFWKKNLKLYSEVYQVLIKNKGPLSNLDLSFETDRKLAKEFDDFLKIVIN